MSDYQHEKVVRLPFPESILNNFKTEDPNDCEEFLKNRLGNLWRNDAKNSFKLGYSDESYYIDWLYYYSFGEQSGDWGSVRLLTEKELNTIRPYFNKLGVVYDDKDLRLVDYCYYNCSEPNDYYSLSIDESNMFITN